MTTVTTPAMMAAMPEPSAPTVATWAVPEYTSALMNTASSADRPASLAKRPKVTA